jgi:hypothetical protein
LQSWLSLELTGSMPLPPVPSNSRCNVAILCSVAVASASESNASGEVGSAASRATVVACT